jgi:hypothetical protein
MAAGPSIQAAEVSANISLAATANLTVTESGCENSPGPQVTLEGVITLGSVCAKVTLSNNAKGTHTATVQREYTVVLALENAITIPKQPVLGGVGGNPHIWIQFTDGDGNSLSEEIYLGRCVQGLNVSADLLNEAIANAIIEATGCSNHKGPFITLGGELVLSGLHAKIIFRNNLKGTHTAEATSDVTLIAEGTTIVLPKQPVRGGVGGNPIITFQFIDCESGDPLDDPVVLGRCVQL